MTKRSAIFCCVAGLLSAAPALGRELPELLPKDREIAIARSAGPASIREKADIYVLKRGGFELAKKGGNGFACLITREDEGSFEPQCFDPEGVASLLPVALEKAKLYEQGKSGAEVAAAIGEGYASGKFRAPRRGGVTYMLSTENKVFNGEKIIAYPPHVMVMAPYVTNADIGADFSDPALPWVLNEGRPDAYVIVVTQPGADKHEHQPH